MEKLAERIRSAHRILLSTHREPDGDGIGSILALGMALRDSGHEVFPVLTDPCPERFRFLDRTGMLHVLRKNAGDLAGAIAPDGTPNAAGGSPPVDLALIVDTNQWGLLGRLGDLLRTSGVPTVFFDHHPVNGSDRSDVFGDPDASSTGELAFRLLRMLGLSIDAKIALCLYTSIAYDTHSFRYVRNSPSPHLIAAEMLSHGVDATHVYRHLFASNPLPKMKILGRILREIRIEHDGKLAWAEVPYDWIQGSGVSIDDLRDTVNYILEVDGVEVALLLKEVDGGEVRISLRSKGRIQIHEVARRMGGGGHQFAAGATVHGSVERARESVLALLDKVLGEADSNRCC
jgi:bifunctional oligoribonuclease and PAP phosphatase NrnA